MVLTAECCIVTTDATREERHTLCLCALAAHRAELECGEVRGPKQFLADGFPAERGVGPEIGDRAFILEPDQAQILYSMALMLGDREDGDC